MSTSLATPSLITAEARLLNASDLCDEAGVCRWRIGRNRVRYQREDRHTLSLYLAGGWSSFRVGQDGKWGSPGRLCLMPQGEESRWQIGGDVEFLHVYFSDRLLRTFAAMHFGCDARRIELRSLVYQEDPELRQLLLNGANQLREQPGSSPLIAEQMLYGIFDRLIRRYNGHKVQAGFVGGGLAPHHVRQVRTRIDDELGSKLTIAGLAATTGLSPFHFARMFKFSFGESPARYVTRARVERVKQLLKSDLPLAQISLDAGFSQQSHMTTHFKSLTGITPAAWRRRLS